MTIKSPFYVIQNFMSPMACEDLLDLCNFNVPDADLDGNEVATVKSCDPAEDIIFERFTQYRDQVMKHFGIEYKGMEHVVFEWLPPGSKIDPHCENSVFVRKQWLRNKSRDLSAVLFLSDYQDQPPFDEEYEVYGGKLEFPQHYFGFNPQRGTLIVFPSEAHFINNSSLVQAGDAFQARFHVAAKTPLIYQPTNFEGNYLTWFK